MSARVSATTGIGYAELVCQSNFSFLTGASSPEQLVTEAAALGYSALAITDECSVAGVVRAYRCIAEQQLAIKLIVGSLFRFGRDLELVLLCPDRAAYAELCRIISRSRRRASKGQYQLELWDLKRCSHCLAIWLPCFQPSLDQRFGRLLKKYFGPRLYLATRRLLTCGESERLRYNDAVASQLQLAQVAVGAVLMHNPNQHALLDTLSAIRQGCTVQQLGASAQVNQERSLRPWAKLQSLFSPPQLQQSLDIARRCQFDLGSLRYEYPSELVPAGLTAMQHLRRLTWQGANQRFANQIPTAIRRQIRHELTLIEAMDYPYFFLTIADIVQFAKHQQILYQGRGSAANSIVCYCLQITAVDPRKINVLFERFISKERAEPPDIDVDFEHERREEIIQYIYQKYGRERAALAASVITYRLRSALREVGKALGFPLVVLDHWNKQLNRRDPHRSWSQQLSDFGLDLQAPLSQLLVQLVEQIRGFPRHLSQHVGGFVISAGPLYELVPIENASMADRTVIQWDKDDLETLGLLKVDILALGMLTAIRKTLQLLQTHHQRSLTLADISCLGDDPAVYQQIQQADTVGVFQIESRAQMSMLPRLKPACYYDLVIEIAIVRPGPIQGDMVHPYLRRRTGLETVEYPSEAVKHVLERTLGVPIFQEQVIKLAMVAAGFTGGEADQLRRAMASWKKNGQLHQFKPRLLSGMQARGYPSAFAEQLFEQMCGFGEYGFPESHSASFALLAYASAWLKHYYPLEFLTALLNSLPMGFYSASQLVDDGKRHGLHILPVCINQSMYDHHLEMTATGPALRLGLRLVKGGQQQQLHQLLAQRPAAGFTTLAQLKQTGVRADQLTALASADALQQLAGHRFESRWALLDTVSQLPLFADEPSQAAPPVIQAPSAAVTLVEDFQALGLSLSQHPIRLLAERQLLGRPCWSYQLADRPNQSVVQVVGLVRSRQSPGTAAGVTFMTLDDGYGNINLVVWQATALAQRQAFLTARLLKVHGIVQQEQGVIHVIAGRLESLDGHLPELVAPTRNFH